MKSGKEWDLECPWNSMKNSNNCEVQLNSQYKQKKSTLLTKQKINNHWKYNQGSCEEGRLNNFVTFTRQPYLLLVNLLVMVGFQTSDKTGEVRLVIFNSY